MDAAAAATEGGNIRGGQGAVWEIRGEIGTRKGHGAGAPLLQEVEAAPQTEIACPRLKLWRIRHDSWTQGGYDAMVRRGRQENGSSSIRSASMDYATSLH